MANHRSAPSSEPARGSQVPSPVLGIDLGTSTSVVATLIHGRPVVIENAEGSRTTPSVVAVLAESGDVLVGEPARRQAVSNPSGTVFSVKRLLGRSFADAQVQDILRTAPYRMLAGPLGEVRLLLHGREYEPGELAAEIFRKLKRDAEARLGVEFWQCVLTVPARFTGSQRQAVRTAARLAGMEVLRVVNEPTAATLARGFRDTQDRTTAVLHLGGGTFDISIVNSGEGVVEVKATSGDVRLGGDDLDARLVRWLDEEFSARHDVRLLGEAVRLQRLREAAELAKIELSTAQVTEISLPFINSSNRGPQHLELTLSRAKLEALSANLLESMRAAARRCLGDARLSSTQVDEILLVGGQTRMPAVRRVAREVFEREPFLGIHPEEAVALGAAIQGAVLKGQMKDGVLVDVLPVTLGVESVLKAGIQLGLPAAPGDRAYGQRASGWRQAGLEQYARVFTTMLPRNATVPRSRNEVFTTVVDGQASVDLHILQGEAEVLAESESLGHLVVAGILPAPRGVPQIEVAFDVDVNGILTVSARDRQTGRREEFVSQRTL